MWVSNGQDSESAMSVREGDLNSAESRLILRCHMAMVELGCSGARQGGAARKGESLAQSLLRRSKMVAGFLKIHARYTNKSLLMLFLDS